jgi:hypothetical protein
MVEDIVMGAHLQWLRRMDKWKDRKWTVFIKKDLEKIGGLSILNGGMHKKTDISKLLGFNQEIIKAWIMLSRNPSGGKPKELKKVALWSNKEILDAKGKPLLNKRLISLGIMNIGDLLDDNGAIVHPNRVHLRGIADRYKLDWMGIISSIPKTMLESIKKTS